MASVAGLSVSADKPAMTPDGRYVAFTSDNPGIVAGFTPTGTPGFMGNLGQVYRLDRETGATVPISYAADGNPMGSSLSWPDSISISDDGNLVLFSTFVPGVVADDEDAKSDVFLRDVAAGTTTRVTISGGGANARISHNGRYVSFSSVGTGYGSSDTDTDSDVYRWDRVTDTYVKASTGVGGAESDKSSLRSFPLDDGRILFNSYAHNLVDGFPYTGNVHVIYRHDPATGTNEVAVLNESEVIPTTAELLDATPDGQSIVFASPSRILASDTGPAVSEVYVQDTPPGGSTTVTPAFVTGAGGLVPGSTGAISPDGRFVMGMVRTDLDPADVDNGADDIYLRDRSTGGTYLVNRLASGSPGPAPTGRFALSGDGTTAVFVTTSSSYGPATDGSIINRGIITRTPLPEI